MLAEMSTYDPPVQFAAWIACLAFLLWFLLLCDKAIQRVRGKAPEPPNGQLQSQHHDLSRRVKNLEDWRDGLIRKLDEDKNEIIAAGERREKTLKGEMHFLSSRVDGLQGTVAQIPNEFMALLANAKNILNQGGGK